MARAISMLTMGILVVLGGAFARQQDVRRQNEQVPAAESNLDSTTAPAAPSQQLPDSARGAAVFEENCTACHSAGGVGSPRLPLDGVGARRSPASLRAWTIGDAVLTDSLAPGTRRLKQGFAELLAADLEALIAFLARLR